VHDINPGKIEIWRQQHHFLKGLSLDLSISSGGRMEMEVELVTRQSKCLNRNECRYQGIGYGIIPVHRFPRRNKKCHSGFW
jgi:hypothetical protein